MKKIIILIPHYNAPSELVLTLNSIDETFEIDILIVDDGSEKKVDIDLVTKNYRSGKIFFIELHKNQGIEKALNHGIEWIKKHDYFYIGRLDCGDLCKPNKFKKQLNYLELNEEVVLLGTWANMLDEQGNLEFVLKHPTEYSEIKKKMYFNSCFVHPSVVFTRKIIDEVGFYPENRKSAEDYAYFFKVMKKFPVANLPEPLLDYVISSNSISSLKRKEQIKNRLRVIWDHFYFGIYPVLGLLRNSILLYTSRSFIVKISKILRR